MAEESSQGTTLTAIATIVAAVATMVGAILATGLLDHSGGVSAGSLPARGTANVESPDTPEAWLSAAVAICARADEYLAQRSAVSSAAAWWQAVPAFAAEIQSMDRSLSGLVIKQADQPAFQLMTQRWDSMAADLQMAATADEKNDHHSRRAAYEQAVADGRSGNDVAMAMRLEHCTDTTSDIWSSYQG
jgi:hypothetical protein